MKVLSTTPIIDDLVSRIGGDRIDHLSLMGPFIDPHSYELVKGDDEKFSTAQVVFCNGLGLEHSGSLKTLLGSHSQVITLGDTIQKEKPLLILRDRGEIDPHIWLDVSLWKEAVDPIVIALSQIDPEGRELYEARGANTKEMLGALDMWIYAKLHAVPAEKRHLVTSHDAFNYFARRYLHDEEVEAWQERFCAPEGLAPDGQLGFHDLQRVVSYVQTHRVSTLFPEANVSRDSLIKIREILHHIGYKAEIASSLLLSDTFSQEASSYEAMMEHNTKLLCEAWDE